MKKLLYFLTVIVCVLGVSSNVIGTMKIHNNTPFPIKVFLTTETCNWDVPYIAPYNAYSSGKACGTITNWKVWVDMDGLGFKSKPDIDWNKRFGGLTQVITVHLGWTDLGEPRFHFTWHDSGAETLKKIFTFGLSSGFDLIK